jgi:hypothetical protein
MRDQARGRSITGGEDCKHRHNTTGQEGNTNPV